MATMSKSKNLSAGVAPQNKKKAGPVDPDGAWTNVQERTIGKMKMGGKMAKSGGSFPDLNKDGKVTKADILKGRGVIAKKGASVKKAQSGTSVDRNTPSDISKMRQWYKDKNTPGKDRNTPAQVKKMREWYKSGEMAGKKAKSGASVKKCKDGCK